MKRRTRRALGVAGLLLLGAATIGFLPRAWHLHAVSGTVTDPAGRPLAYAVVRIKATDTTALTDRAGRFRLSGFSPAFRVHVTAWHADHYVGGAVAAAWDPTVSIVLAPYAVPDHPDYAWIPPVVTHRSPLRHDILQATLRLAARVSVTHAFFPLADRLTLGCADCHDRTIYDQWAAGAHALGTRNPRFLTMYNGTDVHGRRSPPTRRVRSRDYGTVPLPPDPDQPYYGPGYALDFPRTAGTCAACHLPSAALDAPYGTDPNRVTGVDALGSHCDFCHKIAAVVLNPATGQPYENRPGILSFTLVRPGTEPQLFFGPYDDVDAGSDTFLPLMQQSVFCAPCHDASFWGTPIYASYAEWLASPYAARGITCQHCHMAPDGVTTNFAPGRGGLERAPERLPTHHFPGASDTTLLRNAVTMTLTATRDDTRVVATVTLTNDRTGHHVPTDSPLRQMILLVQATDTRGRTVPLLDGPTVPDWGGVGDPARGYYAGQPGKGFAKILQERWTGLAPTGAYWNPTRIVSDNRLAAFATDTSRYTFTWPATDTLRVEAMLLFRRAFIGLMDQKGWDAPDLVMERQALLLDPH